MQLRFLEPLNISSCQTKEFKEIEGELVRKIKAEHMGYLWFFGITEDTFYQLQDETSRSTRRLHCFYNFDEQKLRVRMPGRVHDSLAAQLFFLICDKLKSAGLLNTACVPNLSPLIRLGNIAAEPDGCWGPLNSEHFTVGIEVGNLESDNELSHDARHWIEHAESSFQICLIVKLSNNPDTITLSVWRPQNHPNSGSQLRRRHVSAIITDTATITRGRPDPVVRFESHISPILTPTEIRLPVAAFTGYQLPPGVHVNFGDSIVLTEEDLIEFGRLHWIPGNGYQ
ncbi:uncharacterized protein ACLA_072330 [Aspergillus clavatus NRRL 1]|uniref:Uncharacterized protein n=1 Tax=Aspergillus clavatus (strain ATCC 1007 / CBS 513.65 / DSM 816 / NCTC 3887 / NRRL 1 / QM 1276 / 107) TaxID=344612 RepID=A1C729_ASPCL|nr:uncharacterized protein ACLA_072330 [Aspergillus clavatus NRRL 1]EAW14200.1 hypothetical protein ACLA_072330 [Aspergillus clavatus NRRL 1]